MFARFKEILDSAYGYKQALDREKLKQENVNLLREKLKNSKVVPQSLADKQLLFFLNAYKDDVDKSVELLEKYYNIRRSAPEFFVNRNVDSKEIENCLDNQYYVALPVTKDNHILIFHSLKNCDPSTYTFDDAAKTFIMTTEAYTFYHGPRSGLIYLFDLKGVSFRFLFKPSISSMRKGLKFLEEGIPFNIREVHVFNSATIFDLIIALVKPFVSQQLLQKLHLHHSDVDMKNFHEKYIPKSHLPKEYGGTLGSLDELHEKSRQSLMNLKDYFNYEEEQARFDYDKYVGEQGHMLHSDD